MRKIGVRELKERTSEIVRQLREQHETFEITYHGRAVGRLVPVSKDDTRDISIGAWSSSMDELAGEIGSQWPGGVSAIDAVREQRREM